LLYPGSLRFGVFCDHFCQDSLGLACYIENSFSLNSTHSFKQCGAPRYYEMDTDPWMMDNKADATATPTAALSAALHEFFDCKGDACP
jgi:hypothetical protein